MNGAPAGCRALWEVPQGAAKIHPVHSTLITPKCFLCTKCFARNFMWFITKILRKTEEVSTLILMWEIRKLGLAVGVTTCLRVYTKTRLKTGLQFWNFDSRSWGHSHWPNTLTKWRLSRWGTKAWRILGNKKDLEKNHFVSYILNLICHLGSHQQKFNQMK